MKKQRVLIVDDSAEIRQLVRSILEDDYDVEEADDGEQCIEMLTESCDYDLLILDIEMPGTNGWETLRVVSDEDNWPEIPVVMFTVLNEPENALKAWHIGASLYLTKPFTAAVLLETVQAALSTEKVSHDG